MAAKLGSVFSLCSDSGCVGASSGRREGEVVLSYSNGSTRVYNMDDLSCVHVSQTHKWTTPVIFHSNSKSYWAVGDNNELLSWSDEGGDVRSFVLNEAVHCLLASPVSRRPMLVFSDGHVTVNGGEEGGRQKRTRHKRDMEVVLAQLCHCEGVECVCVVCEMHDHKSASVRVWRVEGEGVELTVQSTLTLEERMVSWCVCGEMLLALSSSGNILSCSLTLSSDSLSLNSRYTLPYQPIKSQLVSVSCDYFTLADIGRDEIQLSLWDTRYFTCQSKTPCPPSGEANVCSVDGYLLVCGNGVMVCSVQCEAGGGTLAAALGRHLPSKQHTVFSGDGWGQPGEAHEAWKERVMERQSHDQHYLVTLTDKDKTSTLKKFAKAFHSRPLTHDMDYTSIAERIVTEKEFWARDIISELVKSQLFPQSVAEQLLDQLVKRQDWSLLYTWLRECGEQTPDTSIVRLVDVALSLPENIESFGDKIKRESLLHLILCQPYNDVIIHHPLSQLPLSTVIKLLTFLLDHVGVEQFFTQDPTTTTPLTYDKVLDWVGLILDIHFTQLTLQPQAKHLLMTLHNRVFKQVLCFNRLSLVQSLGEVQEKTSSNRSDDWLYKVEKLDIRV